MRVAVLIEGTSVYRTEINALVFKLKSRGITVCEDSLSAELIFIAFYHPGDSRELKRIVKQAKLNRNQIYVIFGFSLPSSGMHEECDTVFLVRPENMERLYNLPAYLDENAENASLYMLAKNYFIDMHNESAETADAFSHNELCLSGKSRAVLNIIRSDTQGRTVPVPIEILLQHLREIETSVIKEVYLSGDMLNTWEYDGIDFNELLRIMLRETRNVRFRLGPLLPVLFDPAFYKLLASERICPFFSLSVQIHSGHDGDRGEDLFSFEALSKTVQELVDIKPKAFISLDYEYGNGSDLINELGRLSAFVQKWTIPRVYIFESEHYKNSRAKARLEKVSGEEKLVLERRLRKSAADNLKTYILGQKDIEVDMIIDSPYKDGWLGILPNGLAGFADKEDFYHTLGSLYYGRIFGRYVDDVLFVEKVK